MGTVEAISLKHKAQHKNDISTTQCVKKKPTTLFVFVLKVLVSLGAYERVLQASHTAPPHCDYRQLIHHLK